MDKENLIRRSFHFRRTHLTALNKEAARRQIKSGEPITAAAILREIIDQWIKEEEPIQDSPLEMDPERLIISPQGSPYYPKKKKGKTR